MANGRTGAMIFSEQGGCSVIPVKTELVGQVPLAGPVFLG
jgi:hypothetical protein